MGIISDTIKRAENDLEHHLHHREAEHGAHLNHQHPKCAQDAVMSQTPFQHSPLASGKATGPPSSSSSSVMLSDASGRQSSRPSRHTSLKIRTDSASQPVTLPQQPMTAGVAKPPSPFSAGYPQQQSQQPTPLQGSSTAPKPTAVAPIVIKRNTSFSQRLHNLLHRDKSHKNQVPNQCAAAPAHVRQNSALGGQETPTIAYRTPTSHTTQSNDVSADASAAASANNSPPHSINSGGSATNLARDSAVQHPSSYRAQRNFEPVPEDKVFAVSNTNLRSVQRHSSQIRDSMGNGRTCQGMDDAFGRRGRTSDEASASARVSDQSLSSGDYATDAAVADDLSQAVRDSSMEPSGREVPTSREGSARSVSREPSQNTLHRNQSGAEDTHTAKIAAESGDTIAPASAAAATSTTPAFAADDKPSKPLTESREPTLAERTVPTRHGHTPSEFADAKQRLAAGTTRDPTLLPSEHEAPESHTEPCAALAPKKPCPIYSTHKATLNQFGRQTKVIGKGTGGTVRLLQGAEVNARPPSLRSGPPSSHNGDEPAPYLPSEHKLFAVKEFRKRRPDETPRAYMKKVTSEFCIGSSVHQENVIETLDLIFEGDHVYEIMEYCPHDLFTFVAMGDMDLEETFCWFKQVCQGVQYLHKIGIAHRDLKLENCLVTDRGIVKIIDFGCATVFKTPFQKEPSKVVGVCGSDPYIAPEVLLSRRQLPYYAQVADIWSVGIMYMCMTLLKFPWRIADIDGDRNYGSYIRDWPRGREKLFAQLPKLRHDGQKVIEGMVYPEIKGRLTMDQVMESEWMKEIEVCHSNAAAKSHVHHMKTSADRA
ncbi:serine/threonine protein kinase [Coemansia interrupta]|uniref:non-specific serine/threonine protein kinase n=1 Tax=Coemansia interrupta TaxID=1126814 RepID=A0A9W8H8U2_9FUNG|nr:serine/threonine protein kinase [Coemansia interrupta]